MSESVYETVYGIVSLSGSVYGTVYGTAGTVYQACFAYLMIGDKGDRGDRGMGGNKVWVSTEASQVSMY